MKLLRYGLAFLGGILKTFLVVAGLGVILILLSPFFRCVGEGTLVETPAGLRRVETLGVGDVVLSVSPDGGLAEARVVAVRRSTAAWWRRLSFGDGRVLDVTAAHPVGGASGWRPAGDLRAGDRVQTGRGLVPLQASEIRLGWRAVYDLSIDPYENFIAAGVVVHNKSYGSPEGSAVGDCRAVGSSQLAYASSNQGFFGRMACLGAPTSCGWPAGTTPFLDAQLASLQPKQGYARSFIAGPAGTGKPDPGIVTFVYIATPVTPGKTGNRGFAIDHTGLICFTTNGSVPQIVNGALSPTCTPLK